MANMEEIYQAHARTVYKFLLSQCHDADLAEELTQETFYRAVKNIGKYKGESSVSTWLCGIAKNLWYEHVRRQKKHMPLEEAEEIPVDSAETQLFHSWDSIQVLRLIHNLENPMREVMYLRLVGNLTFGQIGEIMERSENWARVTYYRAKERIVKEAEKL